MSEPEVTAIITYTKGTAKKEHTIRVPCRPVDSESSVFVFDWPEFPANARNIIVRPVWVGGDLASTPIVWPVDLGEDTE